MGLNGYLTTVKYEKAKIREKNSEISIVFEYTKLEMEENSRSIVHVF